jgi:hypothetical protein
VLSFGTVTSVEPLRVRKQGSETPVSVTFKADGVELEDDTFGLTSMSDSQLEAFRQVLARSGLEPTAVKNGGDLYTPRVGEANERALGRDEFRRHYGEPLGGWILAPPAPAWRPVAAAERDEVADQTLLGESIESAIHKLGNGSLVHPDDASCVFLCQAPAPNRVLDGFREPSLCKRLFRIGHANVGENVAGSTPEPSGSL